LAGAIRSNQTLAYMTIDFCNPSRSFNAAEDGVHFWGYDGAVELSFIVRVGALAKLDVAVLKDAADYLRTFDKHLQKIHSAANKVYGRRQKGSRGALFIVTASDL